MKRIIKKIIIKLLRSILSEIVLETVNPLKNQINILQNDVRPKLLIYKNSDVIKNKIGKNIFDSLIYSEIFRGTEDYVKKTHVIYLPYLKSRKNILDVGCGRGEFLELLAEKNIPATGIDDDDLMIKRCHEKKLKAIKADAFTYLKKLPIASLGGIFASQLIEHLSFDTLNTFLNQCSKKLQRNGVIIIETVNPHCLPSLKFFYLDPTHVRPYFPEIIEFMLQLNNFNITKKLFIHPLHNNIPKSSEKDDLCFNYRDYAIIAVKK